MLRGLKAWRNRPLKQKLLLPTLLAVLVFSSIIILWTHRYFSKQLLQQALFRSKELSHFIGFSAQMVHYPYELQRIIYAVGSEPSVKLIAVSHGPIPSVLASNKKSIIGRLVSEIKRSLPYDFPQFPQKKESIHFNEKTKIFHYTLGFYLPDRSSSTQYTKAFVSVQLDTHYLQRHFLQQSIKHIVVGLLALLGLALLGIWLIDKTLLTPLAAITLQMNKRRYGDKNALAPIFAKDEIGRLAETLNQMIHTQEESENLFQRLADIAPVLLWTSNKTNTEFYFSKRWLDFTGQTENIQQNLDWIKNFHEDCAQSYLETFEKAQTFRQPFSLECRLRHRSGEYRWMWSRSVPRILSNGSFEGYIGCFIDISERKEAEKKLKDYANALAKARDEALRSNHAKSAFLATMSHEIRTPMNGILGFAYLLQETSLNDEQKDYVKSINSSTNLLLELINQILDISKIEAGKITLEPLVFNLKNTLNEVIDLFQPMILKKRLKLCVDIAENVPDYFIGDAKRLHQILINLLGNAVKFTHEGSIHIKIRGKYFNENYRLYFAIKDTGIGIAPEDQNRIFKPFEQVTQHKQGGTGLGLSISYSLIQLMGGCLKLNSKVGQGSLFHFAILLEHPTTPNTEDNSQSKYPFLDEKTVHQKENTNKEILLVEDNLENQVVAQKILSRHGYTVEIASNGEDCLEWLKTHEPGLILMDVQMPGIDGYVTTRHIRSGSAGEKVRQIPIIGLTAYALKESCERCFESGMNDLLTKPFKPEILLAHIKKFLE